MKSIPKKPNIKKNKKDADKKEKPFFPLLYQTKDRYFFFVKFTKNIIIINNNRYAPTLRSNFVLKNSSPIKQINNTKSLINPSSQKGIIFQLFILEKITLVKIKLKNPPT